MDVGALRGQAAAWLANDPDEDDRAELRKILDGLPDTTVELAARFAGPLTFGTAGLRGPLRAGPNGMNRAVVRAAAAGLVHWLPPAGGGGPGGDGDDAAPPLRGGAGGNRRGGGARGGVGLGLPRPR